MTGAGSRRNAWLAGATGLVGRELLALLVKSERYAKVHVLLRRAASGLPASPKLKRLQVDLGAILFRYIARPLPSAPADVVGEASRLGGGP